MSFFDKLRSTEVSPRAAVVCIVSLLVLATGAIVTAKNVASSVPAKGPNVKVRHVDVKISEGKTIAPSGKKTATAKTVGKGDPKSKKADVKKADAAAKASAKAEAAAKQAPADPY